MTTKRTTAVSARKSTAKSAKTPLDFSSLFVEHSSEKAMDSQEFLSLIRKSSGVGNSEAKKISNYIASNETLKELFANSQILTEIIYDRAEKILLSTLDSNTIAFPIPVRAIAERCGFEIVEVDFQDMTDEFTWTELQKNLGKSAIARLQMREKLFVDDIGTVAGTIYVQKDLDENSKRFAIAHELGHFVLRTVNPIGLLYVEEACPGLYDFVQEREFLANTFAYALLMPYQLTYNEKKEYQRQGINLPLDYSSWIIYLRDLSQLPEYHVVLAYEKIKLLHMSRMYQLLEHMKKALSFYAGISPLTPDAKDFWATQSAYVTFNALFHDGITSEKTRAREGKILDPSIFDDTECLFQWAKMLQYACWHFASQEEIITYRIDRKVDADELLNKRRTISFTSTSHESFLPSYSNKEAPVLLVFHIPPRTPCVDLAVALRDDYHEKRSEREVLLPPFLALNPDPPRSASPEEIATLTGTEQMTIQLSQVSTIYDIYIKEPLSESTISERPESLEYLNNENRLASIHTLASIQSNNIENDFELDAYLKWKEGFRRKVWEFGLEAWNEIVDR